MDAEYAKRIEALKNPTAPMSFIEKNAPEAYALFRDIGIALLIIVVTLGLFIAVYGTAKYTKIAANTAYEKSPTLQRTIATPVNIFNELKQ